MKGYFSGAIMGVAAIAAFTALVVAGQPPKAGDCFASRCFDGVRWVDKPKIVERMEEPPFQVRSWQIGNVGVWVVETKGVCLYSSRAGGLAAVPKTALPPGVGCE